MLSRLAGKYYRPNGYENVEVMIIAPQTQLISNLGKDITRMHLQESCIWSENENDDRWGGLIGGELDLLTINVSKNDDGSHHFSGVIITILEF